MDERLEVEASCVLDEIPGGIYINGEWRDPAEGGSFAVFNPANETRLADVADATTVDAFAALDAAASAQSRWALTPARYRAELLRSLFDAVMNRKEKFAHLITLEMGKSLVEARAEVDYAAEFLRWFSEEAPRLHGQYGESPSGGGRIVTRRKAVGPSLLITPWNFPLAMLTRKLGPAMAAGCTTVVKPASSTPLTLLYLAAVAEEVGVPAGVLNIVPTSQSGSTIGPLIEDPRLRKISFTGSTAVGQTLARQASARMLRVSMELGGNAPFVVLEDADIDVAVDQAVIAKLRNIGQSCVAANRFYVHASLEEEFASRLAHAFEEMAVGDGLKASTDVGPLIDKAALESALGFVSRGREEGAEVLVGGRRVGDRGFFLAPTVITGVSSSSPLVTDELFAPIAPIVRYEDEADVLRWVNATDYGLASYVFSQDVDRAMRFAGSFETGIVGVNRGVVSDAAAPFGGVKLSGLGREGGITGIDDYTSLQYFGLVK